MATQKDIEALYDWVDLFHERALGKYADFTCAYFNGDFSKTLDDAQNDKHDWIYEGVGIKGPGQRILDIGSGWGPMLEAIKEKGGTGIGLTLSSAQYRYCQKMGLDERLLDWKSARPKELGAFDAVVSVGAFEAFCSEEEYNAGKQEEVYGKFFDFCADVLPIGGKLFLQTMIWDNKVPVSSEIRLDSPEGSPERILARMRKFYPGSWLPSNMEQIVKVAGKRFKFIKTSNGQQDYIETLKRWGKAYDGLLSLDKLPRTILDALSLVPRYLTDPDFRVQVDSVRLADQRKCFEVGIMTHERMFFEKTM